MNETFAISMLGMDLERTRLELTALNIANVNNESSIGNAYRPKSLNSQQIEKLFDSLVEQGLELNQAMDMVIQDGQTKRQYRPDSPFSDSSGLVEVPDLNPLTEMLNVLKAERAYEANAKVFNASRMMAKEALKMGQ